MMLKLSYGAIRSPSTLAMVLGDRIRWWETSQEHPCPLFLPKFFNYLFVFPSVLKLWHFQSRFEMTKKKHEKEFASETFFQSNLVVLCINSFLAIFCFIVFVILMDGVWVKYQKKYSLHFYGLCKTT